jgi:ankyrin repeat protein
VRELAEVLSVDFDDEEGIPKLNPNWRWVDQEQALLTSCSSLITTVEITTAEMGYSRVVQFSHFSVKEYLTSARLATSSGGVSHYHITLEPAHTILAQACMGALLHSSDVQGSTCGLNFGPGVYPWFYARGFQDFQQVEVQPDGHVKQNHVWVNSPLAEYAARHWVTHAQFKNVSSFLRKAMEYLFDLDKPYFAAWLRPYRDDIDTPVQQRTSSVYWLSVHTKSGATPLYYAALCGFRDLVEHLVVKYPQHVNAGGGYYVTPLVAALAGRHFQTAKLLCHNGAHVDVRGQEGMTPLMSAVWYGDLEMVQILLDCKADVSARSVNNYAPIHYVSQGPLSLTTPHDIPQLFPDIARLLLGHGADLNARTNGGWTPLHAAAGCRMVVFVSVTRAKDNESQARWRVAAEEESVKVVRVMLEHGADVGAEDNEGRIPLHAAMFNGTVDVVQVLLEYGANVGAKDNEGQTPLHMAVDYGRVEIVRMLLEHGANVGAKDNEGRTPLYLAVDYGKVEVVRMLLEHGANVSAKDNKGRTPLHVAVGYWKVEVVRMLLEHGANVGAKDNEGKTLLHLVAEDGTLETVRMLLEHGATVGAEDNKGRTPLHEAARMGRVEVERVLLEHGANVGSEDNESRTPFQIASANGDNEIIKLLSEHGQWCVVG